MAGLGFSLWLAACQTETKPAGPVVAGPHYFATIRVESVAVGVGVKVNGQLVATQLPARVTLEVSEGGRALRDYRVYLNRNILAATADPSPSSNVGATIDPGTVTINMDEPLPARIYFDARGPLITGTAVVDRRD